MPTSALSSGFDIPHSMTNAEIADKIVGVFGTIATAKKHINLQLDGTDKPLT